MYIDNDGLEWDDTYYLGNCKFGKDKRCGYIGSKPVMIINCSDDNNYCPKNQKGCKNYEEDI